MSIQFMNLDKLFIGFLALILSSLLTISLPLAFYFKVNFLDNLVVFNINVNSATILLKP